VRTADGCARAGGINLKSVFEAYLSPSGTGASMGASFWKMLLNRLPERARPP